MSIVPSELAELTRTDLLTAAPVADVVRLQREYIALCDHLLDPTDFQKISGKDFKKRSAWRKLAAAFNVTDELVERIYDRDDTGRIRRAEYTVRVTAPNGRSSEGVGIASVWEPARTPSGFKTYNNPEHDIPATAHTRAKNRACADLFGLGEVSADEIVDSDTGEITGGTPEELRGVSDRAVNILLGKMARLNVSTLAAQIEFSEQAVGHRLNRLSLLTAAEYNVVMAKLAELEEAQRAEAKAREEEQNDPTRPFENEVKNAEPTPTSRRARGSDRSPPGESGPAEEVTLGQSEDYADGGHD